MAQQSFSWSTTHNAAYGFTPDVAHLMEFEFWEPILILDDKTQFPESHDIFGYYAGPALNKSDIDWSWVWTKEHGLLARYILRHANSPTDTNRHIVPVSVEIKEEYFNFEPVNFIFDNRVKDWTYDIIPKICYKNAIDTTQHLNEIIDHIIISGKTFLLP